MSDSYLRLIIISLAMLATDLYLFQAVKASFRKRSERTRKIIAAVFWFFSAVVIVSMFLVVFVELDNSVRKALMLTAILLVLFKFFALPALLIDDLRRGLVLLIRWVRKKFHPPAEEELEKAEKKISRSEFLSKAGLVIGAVPLTTLGYGIVSNSVYDYRVRHVALRLPNLPKAFHGLRIGQLSDIHAGSLAHKHRNAVTAGIELLLREKPDVIFFTGDLVNDETAEMQNWATVFEKLKAPLGVYSVTGNHDYGDYRDWKSPQAKKQNFEDLKRVHANMGWDLLMNEHRFLEQGGEKLAIVGVENWGAIARFPKYGKLEKASEGTGEAAVKLLLSHDPSHWRGQVIPEFSDIDAMFSGHTHGMQFGVRLKQFQWSPAQYVYPEWAGMYHEGKQQLYVNVGYGFLGYPGRVGMRPEITIFELERA
ncbi:MAG TPA: metallophosphoesterase [Anseongella sp.]